VERYLCDTCLYANNCQFIAKHKEGATGCSAYINTYGVSVDRIGEICEAERDGRLVVLPCKVGDTVWWLTGNRVVECRIHRIQINKHGLYVVLKSGVVHGAFHDNEIGKTVFLTREEAEAALKERNT